MQKFYESGPPRDRELLSASLGIRCGRDLNLGQQVEHTVVLHLFKYN